MGRSVLFLVAVGLPTLMLTTLLPGPCQAAGISLLADVEASSSWIDTTDKETGEVTHGRTHRVSQLYSLDLQRDLFPKLLLRGGGLFQDTDTGGRVEDQDVGARSQQIQPYVELDLNDPLYAASAGYRRNEIRNTVPGAETTDTIEEYTGRFSYRPTALPQVALQYIHSLASDEPRTKDSTTDQLTLSSNYTYKAWNLAYNHSSLDVREKVSDSRTATTSDNGSVLYSADFLDRRLTFDGGLRLSRDATDFSGGGTRRVQTSPAGAGFFLLKDPAPEENLAGEFTPVDAGHPFSAVNLGRGAGSAPLSVGLDFGQNTKADEVYLLLVTNEQTPDLATPAQIAAVARQFSWRVYASDDQLRWTETPVSSVTYNVFENRFEIGFGAVERRYLKVVTSPLYLAAPGEIRVANLLAFVSLPSGAESQVTSTSLSLNGGLGWRVTDRTSARYDMSYQQQSSKPFGEKRSSVNNGVSVRHVFDRVFSGSARFLRTDAWKGGAKDYTIHSYSASLAARYLDTFSQTLSYAGTRSVEQEGPSRSDSVVLRSTLDLYRGWSLNVDQGYSWQNEAQSGRNSGLFLRAASRVTPNRRMDFNLDYSVSWKRQEGQSNRRDQTSRVTAFLLPFDTLSLNGEVSVTDRDSESGRERFVYQNYSVNWSPFREGALQFSLLYNQQQTGTDNKSRSLSPTIKWRVTRDALLTLAYVVGNGEDSSSKNDFQTVYGDLRIYF